MSGLIDTHAHLDAPEYGAETFKAVIENARNSGVRKIISVGCNESTSYKNIELSRAYKNYIFATYGFHPHNAEEFEESRHAGQIEECVKSSAIVAIGEIGLDYYRDLSPREIQKKVFLRQLAIARELRFPVVIHIRDAFEDFKKFVEDIEFRAVIHCYSGDGDFARWAVDKGLHISFTASITYPLKNIYKAAQKSGISFKEALVARNLQEVQQEKVFDILSCVPAGRIMLETDCPYLSPHNLRGRLNEPANVRAVAEAVAAIKGIDYDSFCDMTSSNAEKFFGI